MYPYFEKPHAPRSGRAGTLLRDVAVRHWSPVAAGSTVRYGGWRTAGAVAASDRSQCRVGQHRRYVAASNAGACLGTATAVTLQLQTSSPPHKLDNVAMRGVSRCPVVQVEPAVRLGRAVVGVVVGTAIAYVVGVCLGAPCVWQANGDATVAWAVMQAAMTGVPVSGAVGWSSAAWRRCGGWADVAVEVDVCQ